MSDAKIRACYQDDAKRMVDMLFDTGIFNDDATRDSMNCLEDFLALHFQQYAETAQRSADFTYKWENLKKG